MTSSDQSSDPIRDWATPAWKTLEFWIKYVIWELVIFSALARRNGSYKGGDFYLALLCLAIPLGSALGFLRQNSMLNERLLKVRKEDGPELDERVFHQVIGDCLRFSSSLKWETFTVIATLWLTISISQ